MDKGDSQGLPLHKRILLGIFIAVVAGLILWYITEVWKPLPLPTSTITMPAPTPTNSPPIIKGELNISTVIIKTGEKTTISVNCVDPDGDALTYIWEANRGTMSPQGPTDAMWVTYTAPATPGDDIIKVTVNDGKGGVVSKSRSIRIVVPGQPP